jgi:acetolactate synthase-1/2/3 large subunit
LGEAATLLNQADRPVVMIGRGVILSSTEEMVMELALKADLPVVTTLLGLDAFPPDHPQALGMPGMHGTERANRAIQAADVILGLGLRFDDRVTGPVSTFAPYAEIIHLDIDPVSLGRTVRPKIPVVGGLRETLPPLAGRVLPRARAEWWRRLGGWSREAEPGAGECLVYGPLTGRGATRAVAARIRESGALVTTDLGQHQMWMAQEFRNSVPGTHLTSGGLGTMGYALPAAIGAALARPDRPVWVVAGDGGFQMNLQELATVAQESLPLKIVVVNNGFLGMVRQWQDLFYQGRLSESQILGPDLVSLAGAYGIPAWKVSGAGDLEPVLDEAEATPGPCLMDLRIAAEEMVFPMVPPGSGLHELVQTHALDPTP